MTDMTPVSGHVAASGLLAPTVAESRLRAGDLTGALEALSAQVRSMPSDAAARVFLFQLLAATGQWGRARIQLEASQQLDAGNAILGAMYEGLLSVEEQRTAFFAGEGMPVLHSSGDWMELLAQAVLFDAQEERVSASQARAQAFALAPATPGMLDGTPFAWLADADPRFGPCLEMLVEGAYAWVACSELASLQLEPPMSLCDTLWVPAVIGWHDGRQSHGFVFGRYPGSERAHDAALQLGRRTEWTGSEGDGWRGCGQRMLASDTKEHALLDVRRLTFDGR